MSPQFRQDSLKSFVSNGRRLWQRETRLWAVQRVSMFALGLAASFTATLDATPPGSASLPDKPYFTHSDCTLPFQVKPGGRCPQQMDLLVSRDAGRTWQIHQTAAPAEGRFRLVGMDEGQYWLRVQVRDAAGSSMSNSLMHLIVDRTRPRAQFDCQWQSDGRLLLSSMIDEAHLDANKVQLTLRTDVDNQSVEVPLEVVPQTNGAMCSAALNMPACKSFELRLCVTDCAGNQSVTAERFFHPVLAGPGDSLLPASDDSKPVTPAVDDAFEIAKAEWTTVQLGAPTTLVKTQLTSVDAANSIVRKPQRGVSKPEELVPPERPQELLIEPPLAPQSKSITQVKSASRKFKIHYNLAEAIPSNQLNVELWVTTDNGLTWEFWGMDRDAQSPAWVEVEAEGEYGFCVVCIHSEADLKYRPSAGDKPDLSVTVKEPPTVRKLKPAARD